MLVAVCSLKGSPGVTTVALALGAGWPAGARRVLVEADPSGGDVGQRFGLADSPGLVSLAAAARRHRRDPDLVWGHAQPLPGELAVVAAPPGAEQAGAALSVLASEHDAGVLRQAAAAPGAVVIVDCGRIDPNSPALPLVAGAEVMLLLSRARADDLAHVAAGLPGVGWWARGRALLLVGAGHSASEVRRELGVPVLCQIPDDPAGAAALHGRPAHQPDRRAARRRGALQPTLAEVAATVARLLDAHHLGGEQGPPPVARPAGPAVVGPELASPLAVPAPGRSGSVAGNGVVP